MKVITQRELGMLTGELGQGIEIKVFNLKAGAPIEKTMTDYMKKKLLHHQFLYWAATRKTRLTLQQLNYIIAGEKRKVKMYLEEIRINLNSAIETANFCESFAPADFRQMRNMCEEMLPLLANL